MPDGCPAVAPARTRWSAAPPSTADPVRLDAALTSLELTVRRRLDGLLQGNHLGLVPGPGTEPGDARPYYPGDDVRRMDWSVTARTTEAHIRQTVADRELETWLVADLSASLDFGTANCEKRDLVVAAAAAVGHLTGGGGNRLGAVVAAGTGTVRYPGPRRQGQPAASAAGAGASTPRSAVGERGDLVGRHRATSPPAAPARTGRRHLRLPRRDQLGAFAAGAVRPARPAGHRGDSTRGTWSCRRSGWSRCWTRSPAAPRRSPPLRSCERTSPRRPPGIARDVATALRRCGAAQLSLSTDRDWIADVLRFVLSRKRGWSGGPSAGRRRRVSRGPASRRPRMRGRPGEFRPPVVVPRRIRRAGSGRRLRARPAPTAAAHPALREPRAAGEGRPETAGPAAASARPASSWSASSC